jgi:HlyD family secretion protein
MKGKQGAKGRALAAGGALLWLVGLAGCGETRAGEASTSPEAVPAQRRTIELRAEATGQIEPIRVVEVKSKASGEILRLHVETGNVVERGALLAEVDPRDVRNALAQAEADLEVAQARLATAEAQRKRSEELRKANVITEQELESAALELANARSQLVKAQTNLELARERMNDVTIRAPLAGTIIQKSVEVGQIIQSASQNISGGTTLFLMADLAEMQVRTLVDETDIGRIEPGLPAEVKVEAFPDRTFMGRVLKVEPQAVVEQNVTMFPVLVRLDNREGLLKPGMNAEVAIQIARKEDALVVPNSAVVGVRDAMAAGAVLGLDEAAMRAALGGGRMGGRPPAGGPGEPGAAMPAAAPAGGTREGEATAQPAGAGATAAAAATPNQADCAALRERMRSGDRASLSEADRAKLRECFQQFGRPGGPGAAGGRGNADVRPGIIFVRGPNGPEPRRVMLGLNDWDYTEVVSGLEEGETVILMSVARIQQQQQEMLNRFRERAGGPIPGAGGGRR